LYSPLTSNIKAACPFQSTKSTHKTAQCHDPEERDPNIPLCATGQKHT